jgi:hypothetical protein
MTIYWFDSDKETPISFPFSIGNFSKGESENKRLWFYSDQSLADVKIGIEAVTALAWKSWFIAKDFSDRPQFFTDYLGSLHWYSIPANTWVPVWVKFNADTAELADNPQDINIRLTGETLA